MPELAEVETVRRQIERRLKGKKITEIVYESDDRYLFAFAKPKDVEHALVGRRIKGAGRKGKYFWITFDRKPSLIVHLGMSGNISLLDNKAAHHRPAWGGVKMWSERRSDKRLWFSRLLLHFSDGTEMALTDPRRFGRIWLADDPLAHPRVAQLGFDPLIDFPNAKIVGERLKRRHKAVKSVLLDQTLFAGVGNWLADEILYQSRISPWRKASELGAGDVRKLRASIMKVVREAVKVGADYEKFPKGWLFHERWGKNKKARTSRGPIVHEQIGGRTAAWVPNWQR